MKHTLISLCPLVLLAAVTLIDFENLAPTPNSHDFDHQRSEGYVAFIVNESIHDTTPKPDPDPAKCACEGTGLITHGDGHQTVCPYHGEDNNPDDGERDWKCDCDSEKKGTYCGCEEEYGKCHCDKRDVKKKECPKCKN